MNDDYEKVRHIIYEGGLLYLLSLAKEHYQKSADLHQSRNPKFSEIQKANIERIQKWIIEIIEQGE